MLGPEQRLLHVERALDLRLCLRELAPVEVDACDRVGEHARFEPIVGAHARQVHRRQLAPSKALVVARERVADEAHEQRRCFGRGEIGTGLPGGVVGLAQEGLGLLDAAEVAENVALAELGLRGERRPAERFDVWLERFDLGERLLQPTGAVEDARAAESTADLGDGFELIGIGPHRTAEAQFVGAVGWRLHHGDGRHRIASELSGRMLERVDDRLGLATLHLEACLDPRAGDRRHAIGIGGAGLGSGGTPRIGPPAEPRSDPLHRGVGVGDAARSETRTHRVDALWPQLVSARAAGRADGVLRAAP